MATEYGTVALSADATSEGADMSVTLHFCYQATDAFDITVNWTFTGTSSNRVAKLTYQELGGSSVVDTFTTPGADDSDTVNLPASTFCYVKVEVTGDGDGSSTLDVNLS